MKNMSFSKYIFVTGGVVSGLGKGITAASLGRLLINRGFKVTMQKLDAYLNVDPGTMNPYRHGEVFVTDDGAETDLDIGHYERFFGRHFCRNSSVTMGKVYSNVISRERRGEYHGRDVQVVPHVTEEIKEVMKSVGKGSDIVIIEVGGTVGEIEGATYIEAIRQFRKELGPNGSVSIHVTLVPYLEVCGEIKTKPTQNSVKDLNRMGIYPDFVVCRTGKNIVIDDEARSKLTMFCNLDSNEYVIHNKDCSSIYEVPILLKEQKFDDLVLKKLGLRTFKKDDLKEWKAMVAKMQNLPNGKTVGVVGKYTTVQDAYISISEAIKAAALACNMKLNIKYINSEEIEKEGAGKQLEGVDAVIVPSGYAVRGTDGKMLAAKWARENRVPFLGIGLGMQMAVVEFSRNVAGLQGAHSAELVPDTKYPVFNVGEMRLGLHECILLPGTKAAKAYGRKETGERFRNKAEFNNTYKTLLEEKGLVFSGANKKGFSKLMEIVEIADHPYFIGVQFHPEFISKPYAPHPLFAGLIGAIK